MLAEFVQKWGLDGRSQALLEGLPADVQQLVYQGFNPPAGTRSVDAKLNAFVRRVGADSGGGIGAGGIWVDNSAAAGAFGGAGGNADGVEQMVSQFALQWGLDEVSQGLLRAQNPDYIAEVTQSFNPPADTRNVSARFCTFLRGGSGFRAHGGAAPAGAGAPSLQAPFRLTGTSAVAQAQDDAAVQNFAQTWGLDDECSQYLKTLSYEALQGVIADFNPPGDTQNINARFMTFVRSREKGSSRNSGMGGLAPLQVPRLVMGLGRQQATRDAMGLFVAKWGLDTQSEGMLRQLQPAQLLTVLNDFSPPEGTLNVNGRLNAFVKSVLKCQPGGGSSDPGEAFAQNWGLDDDAYQALCALPAGMKESVMRDFNPPPGTLNASGKLKAFIRHKTANGEAGDVSAPGPIQMGGHGADGGRNGKRAWPTFSTGELGAFVEKWKVDESAEHTLHSLPEDVLADVMRDFNPPPGTWNPSGRLHAFIRARMEKDKGADAFQATESYGAVAAGGDDLLVKGFVEKWGLDGKSEQLLQGLSQDMLHTIISSFEPDAATRNRNAKLASWVRFLQQSQGGVPKRPRY